MLIAAMLLLVQDSTATTRARDLAGTYRQTGMAWCHGEAVGELKFTADGRFAVTYQPFESYIDYVGSFSWNAPSEVLILKPDATKRRPAGDPIKGLARIDEAGVLRVKGISFSAMQPQADCISLFR